MEESMPKSLIRVLVVDDHPIVRRGLCMEINLDASMQVVGEARDGFEAVALARQLKPDVILMDLVMPQKNGVDATAEILANDPQARVLILTSFSEEDQIFAAIRAGALGSILKDKPPEDLLQAIRDLAQDKTHLDTSIARRLVREAQAGRPKRPEESLTEREMEVLRMVAGGEPYKFIAQKIGVQEATVRTHVSNILSKLGLVNRSQLAMYAISHHLVTPKE
jgi:two-component system, NarL family, response regulator LiaR